MQQLSCVLQLLVDACNRICEHLLDFLTNRYATHVARRLLCLIAGRDVLPIAAKSQNKVSPRLLHAKAAQELMLYQNVPSSERSIYDL